MAFLLSACQSDDKEIYTRIINVSSVPSDAIVVVDGFKLGKTPMSVSVETNENGNFVRKTVITVIPQQNGLNTHVKTFPAYLASAPEKSEVPESITFHMAKAPSDETAVVLNADE